jgi:hypothetical protein
VTPEMSSCHTQRPKNVHRSHSTTLCDLADCFPNGPGRDDAHCQAPPLFRVHPCNLQGQRFAFAARQPGVAPPLIPQARRIPRCGNRWPGAGRSVTRVTKQRSVTRLRWYPERPLCARGWACLPDSPVSGTRMLFKGG